MKHTKSIEQTSLRGLNRGRVELTDCYSTRPAWSHEHWQERGNVERTGDSAVMRYLRAEAKLERQRVRRDAFRLYLERRDG